MNKKTNLIDESFNNLVVFIKERNLEEMISVIKRNFYYRYNINPLQFKNLANFYNEHKLWGEIDLQNNNFELIERNARALIEHCDDFIWLYDKLEDYRSKKILVTVLYYWILLDDKKIKTLKDDFFSQYFDLDLIKCDKNEVFVDIGAYTGDTMINYINTFGADNYKKIFCYEIVPANIEYIRENIKMFKLKSVVIKEKGATNEKGKLFVENDGTSSIKKLTNSGEIEVDTVRVDEDIKGAITFVKMDIEGGEVDALLGMKNKIKKYKPKLAISVYHNNDHLWQIPKIIYEMNPNYKFYLRYYGGPILPTEYILYAIEKQDID